MPRLVRGFLLGLAALIVAAALVGTSALAHAHLAVGRAAVRDRVTKMLNDRMEGTTSIRAVATMWPGPVTIYDVVVRDPAGRLVMRVDRTDLWIRPTAFLEGGGVFAHRVRIRGGELRLVETASGKLTIELAFEGPDRVLDRREVTLREIHFTGARLVIDPEDVPTIVLDDAEGFARMDRTPEQRVLIRLERMTADWESPNPPGVDIDIARMEGWLDSKAAQSFELSTIGEANRARFALELRYFPHRDPGMQLHYEAFDRKLTNLFALVGLEAIEELSGDVESITETPPRPGEERREERRERRRERREARRGG